MVNDRSPTGFEVNVFGKGVGAEKGFDHCLGEEC